MSAAEHTPAYLPRCPPPNRLPTAAPPARSIRLHTNVHAVVLTMESPVMRAPTPNPISVSYTHLAGRPGLFGRACGFGCGRSGRAAVRHGWFRFCFGAHAGPQCGGAVSMPCSAAVRRVSRRIERSAGQLCAFAVPGWPVRRNRTGRSTVRRIRPLRNPGHAAFVPAWPGREEGGDKRCLLYTSVPKRDGTY